MVTILINNIMAQIKCPECGKEISSLAKTCPNCGYPIDGNTMYNNPSRNANESKPVTENIDFGNQILSAAGHFLYRIIYFLFVLPYHLWKKAIIRMDNQRRNHLLDADKIVHEVPFLVWLKRFLFDFIFDGIAIFGWVFGLILTIIGIVEAAKYDYFNFFVNLLFPLYATYLIPLSIAIVKDLVTLELVLPMRWILSFFRRPAKTIDLTHAGSILQTEKK